MSDIDPLKRSIKICMFDQYGTVVDMQAGLTEAAAPFLKSERLARQPQLLRHLVAAHPLRELHDRRLAAPTSTRPTARSATVPSPTCSTAAASTTPWPRSAALVAHIETLRPFPEVPASLARLQTRYRLVVLSNGDPDMLETARAHHRIPFDRVISVAEANSFKPHVATYTKAAQLLGVDLDQVLFIANHAFDCIGAKSAGMRTAFSIAASAPSA